jgi:hypothetical protein
VLLDWARARLGSPLEDVSSWVQSLGHWEPQARRYHDTLVRRYLAARSLEPLLDRTFRRLYWIAGTCNALAGALRYHLVTLQQARTPQARTTALGLIHKWLRLLRCADVHWRAGVRSQGPTRASRVRRQHTVRASMDKRLPLRCGGT